MTKQYNQPTYEQRSQISVLINNAYSQWLTLYLQVNQPPVESWPEIQMKGVPIQTGARKGGAAV